MLNDFKSNGKGYFTVLFDVIKDKEYLQKISKSGIVHAPNPIENHDCIILSYYCL